MDALRDRTPAASRSRQRSGLVILTLLAPLVLAAECRTTAGPPPQPAIDLADARGHVEVDALDALVAEIETARGLAFVRRPMLELVDTDEPRAEEVRERAAAAPLVRGEGVLGTRPLERTATDHAGARVVALRPPDTTEIRIALAHLLDGQHYPGLVEAEPRLDGDVAAALRALLAASALTTVRGGLGPPGEDRFPPDPLAPTTLDAGPPGDSGLLGPVPVLAATGFLRALADREAAFRAPPLSTEQILRPPRWFGSDRPARLAGPKPLLASCEVARDESLGVYALLRGFANRGGKIPGRALSGWRGDRLVVFHCDDGSAPWLYALEADDEEHAAAFASVVDSLLPEDLARPLAAQHLGRRVVVAHAVMAPSAADWTRRLVAVGIRSLQEAL